jgi:putative transposase
VAERFVFTMKSELVWTRDWDSAEELRDALARWLEVYHYERPHQALGWKTPSEKRAENLKQHMTMAA